MWLFKHPGHGVSRTGRIAAAALVLALLAGCGFRPLYATGGDTPVTAELAAIKVERIRDRSGQQLWNFLLDRFNPHGQPAKPLYNLSVVLEESRVDLAIRKDETATRANLVILARYQLLDIATGQQVFRAESRVTTSFNIVRSQFAAISAENAARRRGAREISDDMRTRVAIFFNRRRERGS